MKCKIVTFVQRSSLESLFDNLSVSTLDNPVLPVDDLPERPPPDAPLFEEPLFEEPLFDAPLPEGWEQSTDFSGRTLYVDHVNQIVQFERPAVQSERPVEQSERPDTSQVLYRVLQHDLYFAARHVLTL